MSHTGCAADVDAQLVTASMASGHRKETTGVTIISEAGQPIALRTPWDCAEISVVASPGGAVDTHRVGNIVTWDTQSSVSYDVACAGPLN